MSLQCPYRNVSYPAWRLRVLQNLCRSLDQQSPPNALPTSSKHLTNWGRHYNTSRPSHKPLEKPTADSPNNARTERTAAAGEKGTRSSHKQRFNPYSQSGLRKMKSLLSEIKLNTIEASRQPRDVKNDHPLRVEKVASIPQSPLVTRAGKSTKSLGVPKREPTFDEESALKDNPWAQMLASPLRACQASGARLPSDLLASLGYVVKPEDEKAYLMPVQLADLQGLERRISKELYEEDWRRVREDRRAAREQRASEETQATNKPPNPRIPPRSRLVSDINLIRFLTRTFVEPSRGDPSVLQTKRGAVMRLLPFQAKEAISVAQHYMRNNQQVDAASGLADSTLLDSGQGLYLKDLQWQPDMEERLVRILRKRVIVALRTLAELTKEDTSSAAPARVVALSIPDDGGFQEGVLMSSKPKLGQSRRGLSATQSDKHEANEGNVTNAPLGHAEWLPGSIFLHIGGGDMSSLLSRRTTPSETPSTTPQQSTSSFPSPSPSPSPSASISTLPPLPGNALIPPMITVANTYRFPVFSLHHLLATGTGPANQSTETDLHDLHTLISQTPTLQAPNSGTTTATESAAEKDHLLFIRRGVGPPKALVEEVWHLWRYLAGAKMHVRVEHGADGAVDQPRVSDLESVRGNGRGNDRGNGSARKGRRKPT